MNSIIISERPLQEILSYVLNTQVDDALPSFRYLAVSHKRVLCSACDSLKGTPVCYLNNAFLVTSEGFSKFHIW